MNAAVLVKTAFSVVLVNTIKQEVNSHRYKTVTWFQFLVEHSFIIFTLQIVYDMEEHANITFVLLTGG